MAGTLYLDPQKLFIANGKLTDAAWRYLLDLQTTATSVDLATQVTGVLLGSNGGTGKNNGSHTVTLSGDIATAGNFTTAGAFALILTTVAATNITLPTTGTLMASKAMRVTTGSINAGVSALVTATWPVAFVDANYTVAASVLDATAAIASLQVVHVETVTNAAVQVRVQNTSAGALTGTLNVIALHD